MIRRADDNPRPKEGPFDPAIRDQAADIARQYHIMLEPHERLGWMGTAVEIPTVFSSGKTPDKCVEATQKALTVAVASMLEANVDPPEPLTTGRREEQMNVRLQPREKLILQQAAARQGFRSVSEYVRVVALRDARG
jgi:predicted RNase H-like HicB family nuclease